MVISKKNPAKFFEGGIYLCNDKKYHALFDYLPESFPLEKTFYETYYDVSLWTILKSFGAMDRQEMACPVIYLSKGMKSP